MSKAKAIVVLIVLVTIGMIMNLVTVPFLHEMAVSTNATLATSTNMTNYPGTSEMLLATPWLLYLAYPFIGLICVVLILKGQAIKEYVSRRIGGY